MRIVCIGANHRTAGLAVREKLALGDQLRQEALRDLKRRWADAEFVVVSTCNRTEIYTARPVHAHPRAEELQSWLGEFRSLPAAEYVAHLYSLADADAAEHLFAVAAGLDSLVPGEGQIVAQVKDAYSAAVAAGAAGPVTSELFQAALHTAKHVRSETDIAAGKVSVASVAVAFVGQVFEHLGGKCVLNVGAGKMNELMLRLLRDRGAGRIVVTNRSADRAAALAGACGGQARPFERLGDLLAGADVVLTSTGSPEPIISAEMVRSAQQRRRWRPLLVVDIAVPRDVAADAGDVENVFLYNIDDLDGIVRSTLSQRRGSTEAARRIIRRHVAELMASLDVRNVAPTIEDLFRRVRAVADRELADARNKLSTHADSEEDFRILQHVLHRALRQLLHPVVARLRAAAGTDAARSHLASLRELFGLDEASGPAARDAQADGDAPPEAEGKGPSGDEGD